MDDKLRSYFLESEQEEIVNTISMMSVLPVNDIATFDKFIRWWVEDW